MTCTDCEGTGVIDIPCKICRGTGWVGGRVGGMICCGGTDTEECGMCQGSGSIDN